MCVFVVLLVVAGVVLVGCGVRGVRGVRGVSVGGVVAAVPSRHFRKRHALSIAVCSCSSLVVWLLCDLSSAKTSYFYETYASQKLFDICLLKLEARPVPRCFLFVVSTLNASDAAATARRRAVAAVSVGA